MELSLLALKFNRDLNRQNSSVNKSVFALNETVNSTECSAVLDTREKMMLATELYYKRLLFKCFGSWASSTALEVSADESGIYQNQTADYMVQEHTLSQPEMILSAGFR